MINYLSNDLNINLITGNQNFIIYMKNYNNNRESLRKKSIDVSIKNKQRDFFSDSLFGILCLSSYVDMKTMNIVSSDVRKINTSF